MKQTPVESQILPIADLEGETEKREFPWDYIYEPDAKTVLEGLLTRYIESIIFQAANENIASEQAMRIRCLDDRDGGWRHGLFRRGLRPHALQGGSSPAPPVPDTGPCLA